MSGCKGFFCGSNIKEGTITSDKLDKESFVEFIREIIEEQSKEDWFKEIIKDIISNSVDDDWLREFFKEVFEKYSKEECFKDIICGLGCVGIPEIFDVIPTDITFAATGGEKSIEIVVADDADWTITL